ncbi:unnamed protein product, partial [Rangifer tarandus platyrhynchus]
MLVLPTRPPTCTQEGYDTVQALYPCDHLEAAYLNADYENRLLSKPGLQRLWGPLDRNHRRMHHVSWKLQPLQEERLPPGRVHGPRPSATCPPPHTFEPSPPHLAPRGPALSAELAPSSKNSPRPRVHRRLWLKGSMYQLVSSSQAHDWTPRVTPQLLTCYGRPERLLDLLQPRTTWRHSVSLVKTATAEEGIFVLSLNCLLRSTTALSIRFLFLI